MYTLQRQRLGAVFLLNYAVPHPPKKAYYAARCGKFLQNVRPGAVNFYKMCGLYAAILCKLCSYCAADVSVLGFHQNELHGQPHCRLVPCVSARKYTL